MNGMVKVALQSCAWHSPLRVPDTELPLVQGMMFFFFVKANMSFHRGLDRILMEHTMKAIM